MAEIQSSIVNAGLSCQVRGAQYVPMEELNEWVQDALDHGLSSTSQTSPLLMYL